MREMVVRVPVADLRKEPDHRCERISQVLYGYRVDVMEQQGEFIQVHTDDGYGGWIASSYLATVPAAAAEIWIVISNFATLRPASSDDRFILPHGALLYGAADRKHFLEPASDRTLELVSGKLQSPDDGCATDPVAVARQFVSLPYLWGGTSPYGFDCSGLVQTIFRRCGVLLPRDSKDQVVQGTPVKWDDSSSGDLIFFTGHVALHLGEGRIIHATRLRGMVVIESLNQGDPDFRADLAEEIIAVRRILALSGIDTGGSNG